MSEKGIGAAVRRNEDYHFPTGSGRYSDDLNLAGQCLVCMVRSPCAHARFCISAGAGAMTAPATLFNAISDAVGSSVFTMPAIPEKVRRAIRAGR